ncbi:MAG: hypothetical protein JJLCMIEE_02115 [Acidimicrobiales bacterium]|nr:MAG: CHAD domain-containing protein [Actinomycetota bacterium]MBV6509048.1 hypothetical protein [Acidimicrobiales bacterium]RIK06243.1 MAG: hypothetical protein DCC48_07375 [Acidobacteriota bacterium]
MPDRVLKPDVTMASVLSVLGQLPLLESVGESNVASTLYDTLDWRLYRSGLILREDQTNGSREVTVLDRHSSDALAGTRVGEVPRFASDLPAGRLRDRLAKHTKIRAVCPMAEVRSHVHRFKAVDMNDKTVAYVHVESTEVPTDSGVRRLGWRIRVEPLRGYDREADRLVHRLEESFGTTATSDDLATRALQVTHPDAGRVHPVSGTLLAPDTAAAEAFTEVLTQLLEAVVWNEKGVRSDIDTESLHDFRVAIRRTRSVLAAAKDVLAPEPLAMLRPEFRWLAQQTSDLRDLDVYLLGFEELRSELPPPADVGILPLRGFLRSARDDAFAQLVAVLDQGRYRSLVNRYRYFLSHARSTVGQPQASQPILAVASERIWASYRSLLRHGRLVDDDAPIEALHDLRKRAKKLRYLIDAFRALFPDDEIAELIAALKQLQDNLGELQDCEVQTARLEGFAELMTTGSRTSPATLSAMEVLIGHIRRREAGARAEFAEHFARFDRPRNRKRYRGLFRANLAGAE